ncbi:hypothetical protein EST38_g729 [Candolleomyces aberdarensis]|uniref:Uncharacterized protein n=1 Tax=Candolleomyces aberdarensis TaxID=2316362 RepID=A0A4Q2DZC0_9AGAR|nr:hypothetical protein EST38_g729 [Candolleomyces aberdarensis]
MQFTRFVFAAAIAVFAGAFIVQFPFEFASPVPAPEPAAEAAPQSCQILNSCG